MAPGLTIAETDAESAESRYTDAMSPLRIAGFVLIAAAALFGFANIWYAMTGTGSGLSLYDVWYKFLPGSLNFVQRYIWTGLWNAVLIILVQPAWMVVGVIGLLCIGLGRKRVEE
ncbi:MAG TPA: hypothetical protein VGF43_14205 [Dongiaceae bacterium]